MTALITVFTLLVFPLSILLRYNIYRITDVFETLAKSYLWDLGHVLLGSLIFIILFKTIEKLKIKYRKVLFLSDKYNYYIYLTHQIFILFDYSLLHFTNNLLINIILMLIMSIISGILLKIVTNIIKIYLIKEKYLRYKCYF